MPAPRSLPYQPALDGLRAVAVLAVIVYHTAPRALPGGFLGVDVFFVLSGYLITSLLVREQREHGRIALAAFWARRLRRLTPALLLLLIAVAGYGLTLRPEARARLGAEGLSALFYVSNWHFILRETSYFAQFQAPSPLLHTWSLAIEEQWYLLWPLVLSAVGARRVAAGRSFTGALAVAVGGSALWMRVLYDAADPSRVYYGTDTHAQGLLVGSLLALLLARRGLQRPLVLSWLGVVAGLAVVVTMLTVGDRSAWLYSGGLAGFSVLTAIVIAAAVQPVGWVRRLLAIGPLRELGRISYGAYLWHWPVALWLGPGRLGLSGLSLTVLCLALTVVISACSYRVIEAPIRAGALAGWRVRMLAVGAAGVAAAAFVALRLPVASHDLEAVSGDGSAWHVLVLGDSVAWSLAHGFESDDAEVRVTNGGRMGCGLATGTVLYRDVRRPMISPCRDWPARWEREAAEAQPDVVVVLLGAWEILDREIDAVHHRVFSGEYARWVKRELAVGLDAVAVSGAAIVLLTTPCFDQQWASTHATGGDPAPDLERQDPERVQWINGIWTDFAAARVEDVTLLDLHAKTCPGGERSAPVDGAPLQYDGVHFSAEGAAHVWRWLLPQLRDIAAARE